MPFEIPDSWEWCQIANLGKIVTGTTPSKLVGEYYNGEYPFYKPTDLEQGINTLTSSDSLTLAGLEASRFLPKRSILVTCIGATIGKTGVIQREGSCNQQINAIIPYSYCNPSYIYYCIISGYIQNAIKSNASATTLPILNKSDFSNLLFPLPPFSEQQRIVQDIEKWFALIDDIEAHKSDLLDYIKQAKSKVLDLAIHGKLVPQDPNDEPAIDLLKRINPSFKPCDTSHYENLPFEIPTSWQWLKHNDVISIVGGSQPPKSNFVLEPRAEYVRLYQIRDYGTSPVPVYIPIKLAQKFTSKGDILLARYGGSLGKVFVAEEGAYNVAMAKVVFNYADIIYKNFAYYYYLSDIYQAKLKSISRTAQVGFNSSDFADMWFPIPPYNEQKRIVERIETIFAQLDTITAEL